MLTIPWAKPVLTYTPGAPFQPGDKVNVISKGDAPTSHVGRAGVVAHLEYSCGCGQTFPEDPMIGVRFPEGELEEFWKEELSDSDFPSTVRRFGEKVYPFIESRDPEDTQEYREKLERQIVLPLITKRERKQ
jgi:hypothetical protein